MKSKSYVEKLQDPRWQKKRLKTLERDSFTCRDCGDTEKTLHVHHCYYARGGPWETKYAGLVTVCKSCHQRRESAEEKLKELFGVALAKLPVEAIEGIFEWHDESAMKCFVNEAIEILKYSGKSKIGENFSSRLAQIQEIDHELA